MGRKTRGSRNCKSQTLIFAIQFLRPRQSGAHGTCHACHTLDTPLFTDSTEIFASGFAAKFYEQMVDFKQSASMKLH